MNALNNLSDLKTTLPTLWLALHTTLLSFGINLPALPTWVPMTISVGSALWLAFGIKAAKTTPVIPVAPSTTGN